MYWWLADWPADCRFLTPDERKVLIWRLMEDSEGDAKMDRVNWSRCVRDWKVWVAYAFHAIADVQTLTNSRRTAMYFGVVALNYSTNNFNPTLLKELGYTSAAAQVGRPEFIEVKLIRPDSLNSFVCYRQCLLSRVLLFVDIYQQSILAFAIRSHPW